MKVLHLISHFAVGGAENVVKTVCLEGVNFEKFDQIIVGFRDSSDENYEKEFISKLKNKGINVVKLSGRNDFQRLLSLIKYIRKIRPDIIHTHTEIPDFFGGLASLFYTKARIGRTIHNTVLWPKHKILGIISESIFKIRGSFNIFVSKSSQNSFSKMRDLKKYNSTLVIENPINPLKIEKAIIPNCDKFRISLVGRLTSQKAFDVALYALELLKEKINFTCKLAGQGPELEKLRNLVSELKLTENVKIVGFQKIELILSDTDLLVSSSIFEGLPLTLIESLSASVPVLVSDIEPHREILQNEKYGEMFKINNYQELAEKIIYISKHYDIAQRKANMASEVVRENYHPQSQSLKYFELYKKIVY